MPQDRIEPQRVPKYGSVYFALWGEMNMALAAVFVDGGYLTNVLRNLGRPRIDYAEFAAWAADGYEILRIYYYDCLPYLSASPSQEERARHSAAKKWIETLNRLNRFKVRLGRLQYRGTDEDGRPVFQQKRVDLQLGLDIASLISSNRPGIAMVVLVTGDSDMIPAVTAAQEAGLLVRLVHGPRDSRGRPTYHQDLWDTVDERKEITLEAVRGMERK